MNEFWTDYYRALEGATILRFNGLAEETEWEAGFPSFTVRFADGSEGTIEVSSDPEGNSGGFLFGLPMPK